jgi:hypothetical protein
MQPHPQAPNKSNTLVVVLVIAVVAIFAIVAIVGIMAALGIHGARRYIAQSKTAEGRAQVQALALGIVSCAEQNRSLGKGELLPESVAPVPPTLAEVSGTKYMSSASDWSAHAYACASFSLPFPQYFQYAWRRSSNERGAAIAIADLDGDGAPDVTFELPVTCSAASCSAGAMVER